MSVTALGRLARMSTLAAGRGELPQSVARFRTALARAEHNTTAARTVLAGRDPAWRALTHAHAGEAARNLRAAANINLPGGLHATVAANNAAAHVLHSALPMLEGSATSTTSFVARALDDVAGMMRVAARNAGR